MTKPKTYTHDEVIAKLAKLTAGDNLRATARAFGVSSSYLSDVLQRRKRPSARLLRLLGIPRMQYVRTSYITAKDH